MEQATSAPHTLPPLPPEVIEEEIRNLEERRRCVFSDAGARASAGNPGSGAQDAPPAHAAPADDHARALGRLFGAAHRFKACGLALSGGGIRSATFNLGVIQGLAEHGLLKYLDYLSTVSGGGYIGSWLHGVIKNRHDGDPREATRFLSPTDHPVPGSPDDDPVSFLRKYSNYLVPRPGLFAADTWVIAIIWVRNVLLNQLILAPTVAAVVLVALIGGLVPQVPRERLWGALGPWFETVAAAVALGALTGAVWIMATNLKAVVRQGLPSLTPFEKTPGEQQAERLSPLIAPLAFVASILIAWGLLGAWHPRLDVVDLPALGSWLRDLRVNLAVLAIGVLVLLAVIQLRGGFVAGFMSRHSNQKGWARLLAWLQAAWMVPVTAAFTVGLLTAIPVVLGAGRFGEALPWVMVALAPPLVSLGFLFGVGLLIGLMGADYPDAAREWMSRVGSMIALLSAVWIALFVIAVFGPWAVAALLNSYTTIGVTALTGWLATTVGGVLAGRSARTDGPDAQRSSRMMGILAGIAPTAFMVGYVLLISASLHVALQWASGTPARVRDSGADPRAVRTYDVDISAPGGGSKVRVDVRPEPPPGWIATALRPVAKFESQYWPALTFGPLKEIGPGSFRRAGEWGKFVGLLGLLAGGLVVAVIASTRININEFSLHHFYKNRLVRCYLGASNSKRRKPNRLTGFDPSDEFRLASLQPINDPPYLGPFALVNATLNLNAGSELAKQERKAASFAFSPTFCGFLPAASRRDLELVKQKRGEFETSGYVPTLGYSHPDGPEMGTTVAISGAAANPNMGYHTSGSMAFLLTVFDARLGWWLGNPRWRGPSQYPGPVFAWTYLIAELLGQTTGRSRFVNLSDGGHFDNLGLYELVRRRCHYIIVGDAEEDAKLAFESLGGAIRKCRADFGVEIDIDPEPIRIANGRSGAHCVMGRILYPEGARGYLFYLKASLTGDEPSDVTEYHTRFPEFPHQSTADQFFSESQFESYRRLGLHVVRAALEGVAPPPLPGSPGDLAGTFKALEEKWYAPTPVTAEAASRLASAYAALMRSLSASPNLAALVRELFPEGGAQGQPSPPTALDGAAFAAAVEVIQLMENVYTEFELEHPANQANPRNRGWMMLFGRWARSPILYSQVWAAVRADYNPLFQRFVDNLQQRGGNFAEVPPRP